MRGIVLVACLLLSGCAMPKWGNKQWSLYMPDGRVYKAFGPADGKIHYKDKDVEFSFDGTGRPSILEQALLGAVMTGMPRETAISTLTK